MNLVALTKHERTVKQAILKNKKRQSIIEANDARRLFAENLVEKIQGGNTGARPLSNRLSVSDVAIKKIILASKQQNTTTKSSDNVDEDIIVEEVVINKDGKRHKTNFQMRGVCRKDQLDDEIEIIEMEKEACGSGDNNATGNSPEESGTDEESEFWKKIGLQMVPVSMKKACEVGLKRISTEKRKERKAVGLRSSERIQQIKIAAKKSNSSSIPTVLYNDRKVVVKFVGEGLSSISSPGYLPIHLIALPSCSYSTPSTSPPLSAAAPKHSDLASPTQIRDSSAQSQNYLFSESPCAEEEEPTPSSSNSPVKEGNLKRLRRRLEFCAEEMMECNNSGEKEEKEENLEKLRRKVEKCAQQIKECEEKEMDWAGGAGSRYIKTGKLKKKFTRLYNKLEAHQGSVSVVDQAGGYDWMSSYLEKDDKDPAESNPELEAKLKKQLKEGRSKINK